MRRNELLLALACALSGGCSGENKPQPASDPCADGGAYLRVNVTDDACRAFLEEEARGAVVVDPYKGPRWTSPIEGAVPRATPATFSWSPGTLASASRWPRWLALEGVAHAHGDTTGTAYVLTFRGADGAILARALTTETSYVPGSDVWSRIASGGSLRVDLAQMRVVKNVIASGTKVTAALQISLSVAP